MARFAFIANMDVEVMPVNLSDFFQFCQVIIGIVNLFLQSHKRK